MSGTIANRSVPSATVIPELAYADVVQATDWLCKAFGFTVRLRIGGHRAQLVYGDGAVIVMEGGSRGPQFVLVRVEDADAHHEQALAAGRPHLEPADRLSIRGTAVQRRGPRRPPLDVLAIDRRHRSCGLGRCSRHRGGLGRAA